MQLINRKPYFQLISLYFIWISIHFNENRRKWLFTFMASSYKFLCFVRVQVARFSPFVTDLYSAHYAQNNSSILWIVLLSSCSRTLFLQEHFTNAFFKGSRISNQLVNSILLPWKYWRPDNNITEVTVDPDRPFPIF